MVLSLIYSKKYKKTKIDTIELDALISEDHKYSSKVTDYPVEDGTIISDHIVNEPVKLMIQGIVSDTPINIFAQFNRSIDAFNELVRIHNERLVVTVVSGIKTYQNMAITSLDVPRNLKTGQSLTFNIELQQIKFERNVNVDLEESAPFGGVQSKIVRDNVKENSNIPVLQNDPSESLKDKASSGIEYGNQSLDDVPNASLPIAIEQLGNIDDAIIQIEG